MNPPSPSTKSSPATADSILFFSRPAVLDKQRHATACVSDALDMEFARHTNSVPLNAVEFLEAVKFYPIVFTQDDEPLPVAVLGWEKENYLIDPQNQWRPNTYIPAYVRQYPFIFYKDPGSETLYLSVDEQAKQFHESPHENAEPLFTEAGEASPLSQRALAFCTSFYQHLCITQHFCRDLVNHRLLTPYRSQAMLDGREIELNGFSIIDEKALQQLPEDIFLEFRAKGWLPFIYLALASGTNWKQLLDLAPKRRIRHDPIDQ